MRAIIQRVSGASVSIRGEIISSTGAGLLVLLGVEDADTEEDFQWLASKVSNIRIFADEDGRMNRSVLDTGGGVMVVSQFTLHASTKKGNRPSFIRAAGPGHAEPTYESFCDILGGLLGKPVARGVFGADMQIALVNDGPVTIWIDTKQRE